MTLWFHTLTAIAAVSLASFVGAIFLGRRQEALDTVLMYLVSLSAGVLVGGAMLHLLPHALEHSASELEPSLYFLAGFVGFFFLERFFWGLHHDHQAFPLPQTVDGQHLPHDRHTPCNHDHHHDHNGHHTQHDRAKEKRPLAAMALLGSSLHNFLDGAVIAAAFSVDFSLGWVTTGAILLHEIPREFGDFGILVHAGYTPKKALILNSLTALAAFAGGFGVLVVGGLAEGFSSALLAVTAGTFVYISAAHLIPELQHHHPKGESIGHAIVLLLGVALMLGMVLLEGH